MTLESLAAWLSAEINWNGHMDLDGWGWALMIVFWGVFFLAIAWVAREYGRKAAAPPPFNGKDDGSPDPVAVLDRRLAEGDISIEDYRERRAAIAEPPTK